MKRIILATAAAALVLTTNVQAQVLRTPAMVAQAEVLQIPVMSPGTLFGVRPAHNNHWTQNACTTVNKSWAVTCDRKGNARLIVFNPSAAKAQARATAVSVQVRARTVAAPAHNMGRCDMGFCEFDPGYAPKAKAIAAKMTGCLPINTLGTLIGIHKGYEEPGINLGISAGQDVLGVATGGAQSLMFGVGAPICAGAVMFSEPVEELIAKWRGK